MPEAGGTGDCSHGPSKLLVFKFLRVRGRKLYGSNGSMYSTVCTSEKKFKPVKLKNGDVVQSMSAMQAFSNFSFEELHFADFLKSKPSIKVTATSFQGGAFGIESPAPGQGKPFGSAFVGNGSNPFDSPGGANTNAFGASSTGQKPFAMTSTNSKPFGVSSSPSSNCSNQVFNPFGGSANAPNNFTASPASPFTFGASTQITTPPYTNPFGVNISTSTAVKPTPDVSATLSHPANAFTLGSSNITSKSNNNPFNPNSNSNSFGPNSLQQQTMAPFGGTHGGLTAPVPAAGVSSAPAPTNPFGAPAQGAPSPAGTFAPASSPNAFSLAATPAASPAPPPAFNVYPLGSAGSTLAAAGGSDGNAFGAASRQTPAHAPAPQHPPSFSQSSVAFPNPPQHHTSTPTPFSVVTSTSMCSAASANLNAASQTSAAPAPVGPGGAGHVAPFLNGPFSSSCSLAPAPTPSGSGVCVVCARYRRQSCLRGVCRRRQLARRARRPVLVPPLRRPDSARSGVGRQFRRPPRPTLPSRAAEASGRWRGRRDTEQWVRPYARPEHRRAG
jgi:hypothetical protein